MTETDLAPGRTLTRWRDENTTIHALRHNGAPACGCDYHTTTGAYPGLTLADVTCERCKAVLHKLARVRK
jgi:hypothetical protein